jgi:hypothetical protein
LVEDSPFLDQSLCASAECALQDLAIINADRRLVITMMMPKKRLSSGISVLPEVRLAAIMACGQPARHASASPLPADAYNAQSGSCEYLALTTACAGTDHFSAAHVRKLFYAP